MYSKTRNTLTALTAASLFVVAGWMFGRPVAAAAPSRSSVDLHAAIAETGTSGSTALHARRANRMTLAMPYFSFALTLPQRRND